MAGARSFIRMHISQGPPSTGNPALDEYLATIHHSFQALGSNTDSVCEDFPFAVAVAAGKAVNIYSDGGVLKARLAIANSADTLYSGFCATAEGVSAGGTGQVIFSGRNDFLSGLAINTKYYLSADAAGEITTVPPSISGTYPQYIGTSISASSLSTAPNANPVMN